jgi:endogenous inhibitor of DNA gyrase (YacG/DUF329 family)
VRVTCPICKKVIEDAPDDHQYRPFCGKRCKLADLHNWLTEGYRISGPIRPGDVADDDELKLS